MQDINNPTFANYSDVLMYQKVNGKWRHQDSVFFSIPEKVIQDVVSVLEKSGQPVNKISIASEFEANKRVFEPARQTGSISCVSSARCS